MSGEDRIIRGIAELGEAPDPDWQRQVWVRIQLEQRRRRRVRIVLAIVIVVVAGTLPWLAVVLVGVAS